VRMNPSATATSEVVCLVDDDPAVLTSIRRLLASERLAVRTFHEPAAFLQHVEEQFVPVAVLDVWMEQMTGLELQAKLARTSPRTRVIIMTGRRDAAVEQTAREFGASAFFMKPFDDEEFLNAVRRALASES
jgi:FixJ family two-component response regulator